MASSRLLFFNVILNVACWPGCVHGWHTDGPGCPLPQGSFFRPPKDTPSSSNLKELKNTRIFKRSWVDVSLSSPVTFYLFSNEFHVTSFHEYKEPRPSNTAETSKQSTYAVFRPSGLLPSFPQLPRQPSLVLWSTIPHTVSLWGKKGPETQERSFLFVCLFGWFSKRPAR